MNAVNCDVQHGKCSNGNVLKRFKVAERTPADREGYENWAIHGFTVLLYADWLAFGEYETKMAAPISRQTIVTDKQTCFILRGMHDNLL